MQFRRGIAPGSATYRGTEMNPKSNFDPANFSSARAWEWELSGDFGESRPDGAAPPNLKFKAGRWRRQMPAYLPFLSHQVPGRVQSETSGKPEMST